MTLILNRNEILAKCANYGFGGFDVGLNVYGGYSAIVLGPFEKCCK